MSNGKDSFMKRSLDSQTAFFHNLGDGSNRLIKHFHETRPPAACDPRVAGLQTVADVNAFITGGGADALSGYNLSARADDSLPVRLAPAAASPVGLILEDYLSARSQPLPLGGLDTPDLALRETQAAWVARFETDLLQLGKAVYGRNRRAQRRLIEIALLMVAGTACAGAAVGVIGLGLAAGAGAAAIAGGIAASEFVLWRESYNRRELLKDFHHRARELALSVEAQTRHRQDNLVALIDSLFAAAGHLRDDAGDAELSRLAGAHIRMIFALRTLLSGNRKCTRYHVRMLEMVREARSLQMLDEALIRRRRLEGGYISHSTRRFFNRVRAMLVLGPVAGALPWLGAMALHAVLGLSLPVLVPVLAVATAGGALGLAYAWIRLCKLRGETDTLVPAEDLARLCDEAAFDQIPGPADVALEQGFSRMIERYLARLVREENKQH